MPRTARKVSKSGVYHVMLRGINRQDIFEDSEDYWTLIKTLAAVVEPHRDYYSGVEVQPCHIYAYCLMPNHVHLLIQEKEWKLAEIVKYIASKYVRHYNQKYGRIGHLFQDRFKSEPCDTSEYFFTLLRYIHQNPVKAGLCKAAKDYEYSSWGNDYLRLGSVRLCDTEAVIHRYTMAEIEAWVDMPLPESVGCIDLDERRVIADETIRQMILQKCGCHSITEFQLHDKERQKDILREVMLETGAGPRQMSRVSRMSYSLVYRLIK